CRKQPTAPTSTCRHGRMSTSSGPRTGSPASTSAGSARPSTGYPASSTGATTPSTPTRRSPSPCCAPRCTPDELAAAGHRYPKWATMCQLRGLGLPVLDGILLTPGQDRDAVDAGIAALAAATGQDRVMIRSDGGTETRRYYKGGNTFQLAEAAVQQPGCFDGGFGELEG